jgi:hypothetical protein
MKATLTMPNRGRPFFLIVYSIFCARPQVMNMINEKNRNMSFVNLAIIMVMVIWILLAIIFAFSDLDISRAIADAGGDIVSFGNMLGENATNRYAIIKVKNLSEEQVVAAVQPFSERITDVREV